MLFRGGWRGILFLSAFIAFVSYFIWFRYIEDPWFFFTEAHGHPLFRWVYYIVAYFSAVLLVAVFFKKQKALLQTEFWLISFVILAVLYLNHFRDIFELRNYPAYSHYFLDKVFYNLQCVILYSLAPLSLWILYYRKRNPEWKMFGWTKQNVSLKPYFIMLLLMLPLLIWASTKPDFLQAYPRYRPGAMEQTGNFSPFFTIGIFELSYVFQFVALEWFFRGFVVFSLSRFFEEKAVWIMVAVYVFLHFNKPMHESIGSFFGGYVLGIIAQKTGSVYGGMIVHVGIALIMEFLAAAAFF